MWLVVDFEDKSIVHGLLKKEIASGKDPKAQAYAKEILPTVQAHLKKIREIAASAGVTEK